MKLNIDEFEKLAEQKGISPKALLIKLGGGRYAYKHLKKGCSLGYDLARDMYNSLGEQAFLSLIIMEDETVYEFKNRYMQIAGKLY